jgi:hypothetical protein
MMTRSFLKIAALAIIVSAPLGACMSNAPSTPEQAQYLATLRSCPPGSYPMSSPVGMSGYRCMLNP